MNLWTSVIIFHLLFGQSDTNDPDYGVTWMYMPDGNGEVQKANLSEPPENEATERRAGGPENNVLFFLFTRRNPNDSIELYSDTDETLTSGENFFEPSKDVKFIIHGWMSSKDSSWVIDMKDAFLSNYDLNVIVVDWSSYADNIFYLSSARRTKDTGQETAKLIDRLIVDYQVSPHQFHVIGHSLGAHVSGYAGSFLRAGKMARITGLDPASPGFEYFTDNADHLDESDAQFVDIIHTSAGVYGYRGPLGHADFYPNRGTPPQPGCEGIWQVLSACSHGRSYEYFIESVRSGGFDANYCPSNYTNKVAVTRTTCQRSSGTTMGENASPREDGIFYLETNAQKPYSKSEDNN